MEVQMAEREGRYKHKKFELIDNIKGTSNSIEIEVETDIGFTNITIVCDEKGRIRCYSNGHTREFVETAFKELVKEALDTEDDDLAKHIGSEL
jgi:hypothetical protein